MALFMSRIVAKIDTKGRVSVPAGFRTAIVAQNRVSAPEAPGIFVYPSFAERAIEGGGIAWRDALEAMLEDAFDPFSKERDVLNNAIFGKSDYLYFDSEGRVNLPASLLQYAGIDKELCFVGLGERFQIWNPQAYDAAHADTDTTAAELSKHLKSSSRQGQKQGQAL